MLNRILGTLGIIIVGLAILISLRPNEFRVTRSLTMAAPASAVFAQVNDLHKWEAWSPWAKLDPNMKQTYEGTGVGTGTAYTWSGNNQVGEGRTTIVESKPNELVKLKLEFFKPFQGTNTSEFTFKPEGQQTVVTWSMYGQNSFMSKAMSLFMNCDQMVGGQFEKGLAQMKSIVENKRR